MQKARKIAQIVFILFFIFLFIYASLPLIPFIPVDSFLLLDPLAMFSSSIAGRQMLWQFIPALILIFLTLFTGRFFCGWICPLGTTIDGFDKLGKVKSNNSKTNPYRSIKYILLIVVLVLALFSVQIASWIDPIPLMTRTMATVIYPVIAYLINGLIGLFYSFIFLEEFLFNLEQILQGRILLTSSYLIQGILFNFIVFALIIGLSQIQKRFWCRNLCPLGALLAIFSKFRIYRRQVSDQCTECGLCYRNCRTGAINLDFLTTRHVECINCMDCVEICPENAISFVVHKSLQKNKIDLSRRQFVSSTAAGIFSFGLLKSSVANKVDKGEIIRPPGALREDEFLDRCLRCGECVRACSTSGRGLQLTGLTGGLESLGTPSLKTPDGYCKYLCNACGEVCPTGAILSLPLSKKKITKIGTAHINKNRCIPWDQGQSCTVCYTHCPVPDKAIHLINKTFQLPSGQTKQIQMPYVDEDICIGCGVCTAVCPVQGEKGIYLTNKGQIRS